MSADLVKVYLNQFTALNLLDSREFVPVVDELLTEFKRKCILETITVLREHIYMISGDFPNIPIQQLREILEDLIRKSVKLS